MSVVTGDILGEWSAPGRVNLIGEHTDYNDGLVLPFAIDRRAVVRLVLAEGDRFPSPYIAGVVSVLREQFEVPALAIMLDSNVPIGAGLSSSAALTCATALAINEAFALGLSRVELVLVAQRAENHYVGAPTGILDQSASLLCTPAHALLLDCRDRSTRQVPLELDGAHLLVVDTGISHDLADGSYARRRSECEDAARWLGVPTLREADGTSGLDGVGLARARHVLSENQRVRDTVACLEAGDLVGVGELLLASHRSLRDDFEVSWPEADAVVAAALTAGALGARMVGGGFGGSVLVLTRDPERAEAAVSPWAREVFEVRPAGGAVRVR